MHHRASVTNPVIGELQHRINALERELAELRSSAFLSLKELCARWGISRGTLYRRMKAAGFPRPVLFPRRGWRLSDIVAAERSGQVLSGRTG